MLFKLKFGSPFNWNAQKQLECNSHVFSWHFGKANCKSMLFSFSHYCLNGWLVAYQILGRCQRNIYTVTEKMIHTTGVSASTSSSKAPPGDVRPGHIMFAPARTNFIAPRSTWNFFIMFGSAKQIYRMVIFWSPQQ